MHQNGRFGTGDVTKSVTRATATAEIRTQTGQYNAPVPEQSGASGSSSPGHIYRTESLPLDNAVIRKTLADLRGSRVLQGWRPVKLNEDHYTRSVRTGWQS